MKKLIALILSLCMLAGMLPAMAETAAGAPAEKVQIDRLIDQILSDILNAAIRVDAEDARANSAAAPELSEGNVFAILNKVLNNGFSAGFGTTRQSVLFSGILQRPVCQFRPAVLAHVLTPVGVDGPGFALLPIVVVAVHQIGPDAPPLPGVD